MTKETMQVKYKELEDELSRIADVSMRLRAFIGSQDFKELSDLEATLAVTQHHQLEAYARVLTMRAALIGGRLKDPDGDRPVGNDETQAQIVKPEAPEISTEQGVAVGNTIITGV